MAIPYKTTRYGCEFKCGTRRRASEINMQKHEAICWLNPENKTCKTCKNEEYEFDYCDHSELDSNPIEEWIYRGCKNKEGEDLLQSQYDSLKVENSIHVKPIFNCPFWENKVTVNN